MPVGSAPRVDRTVVVAQLLLCASLVVAGYIPYTWIMDSFVTARQTELAQEDLTSQLNARWERESQMIPGAAETATTVSDGAASDSADADPQAEWIMRIPRLDYPGYKWKYAVVEGIGVDDIRYGPGHDPSTTQPGEVGNAVFAAHRNGRGSPFDGLDRFAPCDQILIEKQDVVLTYLVLPFSDESAKRYSESAGCFDSDTAVNVSTGKYQRVLGREVVTPDQVEILDPLPDGSGREPDESLITLYTCHPRYSNRQRLVIRAALYSVENRALWQERTIPSGGDGL